MAAPQSPVGSRRRLGAELRRLREEANLRLDAVADELEVSASKISRIETGNSTAKTWDVRNLLTLYGVTDEDRRTEVLGWAADAKAQAWWQDDIAADDLERLHYYISLEAEAASVRCYCTPVLHALLQTEDYARAHLASIFSDLDRGDIDRLASVQLIRESLLRRPSTPLRFSAIVDEAVLYRRVGSAAVMRGQLEALLAMPETVELRVRPLTAQPHRAIMSPFTIFNPRLPDLDPTVVAVEASMTDSYLERPEDVAPFQSAYHDLRDSSLEPRESLDLIRSLLS